MENTERRAERLLEQVSREVQEWRQTRPRPRSMPTQLWEDVIALARAKGVYRISKALGLNYTVLRKRALTERGERGTREQQRLSAKPAPTKFMELQQPLSLSPAATESSVEVVAPDGARLLVRVKGVMDFAALVRAFRVERL